MSDYDLIEARYTISTLQTALARATAQVRELQTTIGALNERVAIGNEQIENLALDLSMERLRGESPSNGTTPELPRKWRSQADTPPRGVDAVRRVVGTLTRGVATVDQLPEPQVVA